MISRLPTVFLMDNGSLRPEAVRQLRRLASRLGKRIGQRVVPVSMLHADKIPPAKLGGRAAEVFASALRRRAEAGDRDFVIVPLYIGRSATLTHGIPEKVRSWRREFPMLRVRIAPPLGANGGRDLGKILRDAIRAVMTPRFVRIQPPSVALVDHGSPSRSVTRARSEVCARLKTTFPKIADRIGAASMERRPGPKYAFNEPLLADLLDRAPFNAGQVVIAQLFILPGRHAGPKGDIAQICERAKGRNPELRTKRTQLLGSHPGLIDVLAARFRTAVTQKKRSRKRSSR
jgi:sirohydrochlorin ferrochelatase